MSYRYAATVALLCLVPMAFAGNPNSPVGANMSTLDYWATEWTTIDLMKTASGWIPQNSTTWDTGETLDLDADGWVQSLPDASDPAVSYRYVTRLLRKGTGGHYPAGQYIVLYDGEGTLSYSFDAVKNAGLSAAGRDVLDVTPTNAGFGITINTTDPSDTGNYIRNIRIIHPGGLCNASDPTSYCETAEGNPTFVSFESIYDTQIFHPAFLENLENLKVIRFLEPLKVNNDQTSWDWNTRAMVSHGTWNTNKGMPYEAVIHLANLVQTDIWITLPTHVDDFFVEETAKLFKSQLDPSITVYVEYGNEIWNTSFPASNWVQDQGVALFTGSDSGFTKRINYYGMRTHQVLRIWKTEWADRLDKVIGVLGAQAPNTWTAYEALSCPLWSATSGESCEAYVDTIAIAPYFGGYFGNGSNEATIQAWTAEPDGGLNNMFRELLVGGLLANSPAGGALAETQRWIDAYLDMAREKNLSLTAYEGGSHMVAGNGTLQNDAAVTQMFTDTNRDPRMHDVYMAYLAYWYNRGGDVFVLWKTVDAFSRYGSWGLKEYQDQPLADTPKQRAVNYLVANAPYKTVSPHASRHDACLGDNRTFSITATGTNLTYQWKKDGVDIPNATTDSFTLSGITALDVGEYQCLVAGQCSQVTSFPFNLSVTTAVQPLFVTSAVSHCTGMTHGATVIATALGQAPFSYQWFKDGSPTGDTTQALLFDTVAGNEGTYYCVVSDACGNSYQTADIAVTEAQPAAISTHTVTN